MKWISSKSGRMLPAGCRTEDLHQNKHRDVSQSGHSASMFERLPADSEANSLVITVQGQCWLMDISSVARSMLVSSPDSIKS